MGLFSSLYTGVNGMTAQSNATSAISGNIANSTTTGYKKVDTMFYDLVATKTSPNNFSHGGVFTEQIQRNDIQGSLQQTGISTEMGISGAGFFAVKSTDDPNIEFLYTRNGTFTPDSEGVLRNSAGFILYGWEINEDGTIASGNTLESLTAVDVDELNETHRTTSQAELSINLDAEEAAYNPMVLSQAYPVNNYVANFSRSISVVDGDGVARELNFEFRKVTGPMAYVTTGVQGIDQLTSLTDANYFSNITAGDSFSISASGFTQEYIIGAPAGAGQVRVDTVGDLTNHINTQFGDADGDGNTGDVVDAILDENGRLTFKQKNINDTLVFTETSGTPLTGGIGTFDFIDPSLSYSPIDIDATYPDQANLPTIDNTADPNTNGWWEVTITTADPSDPTNTALPAVAISTGLMSFNSDGTLNAIADATGFTGATLSNINFDDASSTDTTSLTVDMASFSQFAGAYNVVIENHNGAEAGTLTAINITNDGRVVASFSNNEQFEIFQVPLAKFINPNGLARLTGTVFAATQEAGDVEILEADDGGTGRIIASTVETSNVDIADEFANLIVTQRAFSANSKVVNTVDEMTQQLRTLKQ